MTPEDARRSLHQGGSTAVISIRTFLEREGDRARPHSEWAAICDEVGLTDLALRERILAVRRHPTDAQALIELGLAYEESGDVELAKRAFSECLRHHPSDFRAFESMIRLARGLNDAGLVSQFVERAERAGLPSHQLMRLRGRRESPRQTPVEVIDEKSDLPDDATLARMVELFRGREDTHARQWHDPVRGSGYAPVKEPLSPLAMRNHLLGNTTLGSYVVRLDDTVTWFAVDIDIKKTVLEAAASDPSKARAARHAANLAGLKFASALRSYGFSPLLEDSGHKGRHLWVFFAQPVAAEFAHRLGSLLSIAWATELDSLLQLEFFPKQSARSGKGFGNLIKLPLGIHRRTGRRSTLLDPTGKAVEKPFEILGSIEKCDEPTLRRALDKLERTVSALLPETRAVDESAITPVVAKPLPPAAKVRPPWTEADFELDREVAHVFRQCGVLRGLRTKAEQTRTLTREEQKVLKYTLGHLTSGPLAVNHLLGKCPGIPTSEHLKSRLHGNAMACSKIRSTIPHITTRAGCDCGFLFAPEQYPTPSLHLLTLESSVGGSALVATNCEEDARRYGVLMRRFTEIREELDQTRSLLLEQLRAAETRSLAIEGGTWMLREINGVEELLWVAEEVPV